MNIERLTEIRQAALALREIKKKQDAARKRPDYDYESETHGRNPVANANTDFWSACGASTEEVMLEFIDHIDKVEKERYAVKVDAARWKTIEDHWIDCKCKFNDYSDVSSMTLRLDFSKQRICAHDQLRNLVDDVRETVEKKAQS